MSTSSTCLFKTASFFLLAVLPCMAASPTLNLPATIDILNGAPLHIPLDAFDADGDALSFSISVSDDSILETFVPMNNRSLELNVADFGTMTFELFEERAPRTTGRIIELVEDDFYSGITFHRVINDFVLQAGDPTGTGAGGSSLPDFDDEFHLDLLHGGPGILSMAKSNDDTNNSQFFITEVATPWLDFNHSIFGLLTEGEGVRDEISNTEVDSRDRPNEPVVIESARIFNDDQNGVLMLKALQNSDVPIDVAVTVSDGTDSITENILVSISDDTNNHAPFMRDLPEIQAMLNTSLQFQLDAVDLENDGIVFEVFAQNDAVEISVDSNGLVTMIPPDDFVGELLLAARVSPGFGSQSDTQFFSLTVVPEPSSFSMVVLFLSCCIVARKRSEKRRV